MRPMSVDRETVRVERLSGVRRRRPKGQPCAAAFLCCATRVRGSPSTGDQSALNLHSIALNSRKYMTYLDTRAGARSQYPTVGGAPRNHWRGYSGKGACNERAAQCAYRIVLDSSGNIYFADTGNSLIRAESSWSRLRAAPELCVAELLVGLQPKFWSDKGRSRQQP